MTPPEATAGLSESDSVEDINVPIRIKNKIDSITSILSEDDEKDELTDDEKREALRHEYEEKRRKRQRKSDANFAEDFTSLRRDAGSRRQNDVTGIPREMDNLKSAGNLKFEDINIDEYLDNKIIQNTKMTNSIKSTLSRLDNVYGKPKSYTGVISEINSSEEEK
jgi:hypothetical protein